MRCQMNFAQRYSPRRSPCEPRPQRLRDYLSHIAKAIERIDRYTHEMTEVSFMHDEMAQDAVIRNFEVIGEANHNIEVHHPEFAQRHPQLPLAVAYQMRNAVAQAISRSISNCGGRRSAGICQSSTGRSSICSEISRAAPEEDLQSNKPSLPRHSVSA